MQNQKKYPKNSRRHMNNFTVLHIAAFLRRCIHKIEHMRKKKAVTGWEHIGNRWGLKQNTRTQHQHGWLVCKWSNYSFASPLVQFARNLIEVARLSQPSSLGTQRKGNKSPQEWTQKTRHFYLMGITDNNRLAASF